MARIRTIKPEFFTSEDVVSLSPMARLLFIATWCEADKEGRLVWRPMTFKLRYLPADQCDVSALCAELVGRGLVVLYGEGHAYIPSFKKHQHINPRESESSLPDPDASARVKHASARVSDAQGGRKEGKGREGKGKEGMNTSAPDGALCEFLPEVEEQTMRDWLEVRKAKRAGPVTATVADGLRREAEIAGLSIQEAVRTAVERGWQGFRADWLTKTPPRPDLGPSWADETPRQRAARLRMEEIAPSVAAKRPGKSAEVIDVFTKQLG